MHMSYREQDTFFAQAYRTGTDHWTNIPYNRRAHELALYVPKGALILDLGTGRGRLLFELADLGFRAIGLENGTDAVKRGNNRIKDRGLEKDIRFLEGTALDIPLVDESFDAIADVGLLHHIKPEDYAAYVAETARVLKPGGFFFLVVLSKITPNYLSWHPSKEESADFEQEGVKYHFFGDDELKSLFAKDFDVRQLDYDHPYGPNGAAFAVVLLKKK
jgi:cyclopropane fatty-acyl-phospholipid synthase-like methyltransferase